MPNGSGGPRRSKRPPYRVPRGFLSLAVAVIPVVMGTACDSLMGPSSTSSPLASIAGVDPQVSEGFTDFGFEVFGRLSQAEPNENIFFSGTSLAFALAMTYHGMDGETRAEVSRALGVDGVGIEEFNASNLRWLAALNDDPGDTELAIANSVWATSGFPFEDDFLRRNEDFYRATVRDVDFLAPATVGLINAWVSDQTRGRIDTIVEEIDPNDIMFLINAVYFLGEWTVPFDEDGTVPRNFTQPDGTRESVPTMTRRDTMEYRAGDGYEAVRLPYGDDERFSMYVFVPDRASDLPAFYDALDAAEWERRIGLLEPTFVELRMPRFTLEFEKQLIPTLQLLGIELAFDPYESDFSPMTRARDDVYISEVLQKTFVQVNETGTEAAAVTSVGVSLTSAPPYPIISVDRPFFVAIRDDETGTVLFQGQITRPDDSK